MSTGKWFVLFSVLIKEKPADEINISRTKPISHLTHPIALLLVGALLGVSGCLLEFDKREDGTGSTEFDPDDDHQNGTIEQYDIESDTEDSKNSGDTGAVGYADTDTETELPPCPTGLDLGTNTVYLDLIDGISYESNEYEDFCEDGEIIVGFYGFFTELQDDIVHGKIQALCAKPEIRSQDGKCAIEFGTAYRLPLRGHIGDIEWTRRCPAGEVIAGYQGRTGADVDKITFSCARLTLQTGENGYTISRGESTALPGAGGNGGNYDYQDECPENHAPMSTIIHTSNSTITALGLGCQKLSLIQ